MEFTSCSATFLTILSIFVAFPSILLFVNMLASMIETNPFDFSNFKIVLPLIPVAACAFMIMLSLNGEFKVKDKVIAQVHSCGSTTAEVCALCGLAMIAKQ